MTESTTEKSQEMEQELLERMLVEKTQGDDTPNGHKPLALWYIRTYKPQHNAFIPEEAHKQLEEDLKNPNSLVSRVKIRMDFTDRELASSIKLNNAFSAPDVNEMEDVFGRIIIKAGCKALTKKYTEEYQDRKVEYFEIDGQPGVWMSKKGESYIQHEDQIRTKLQYDPRVD